MERMPSTGDVRHFQIQSQTTVADLVRSGNGGKGLATIFAGFIIAPALAAGFASILFLGIKFGVLARKDPVRWALGTSPLIFFLVGSVLSLSISASSLPILPACDLEG